MMMLILLVFWAPKYSRTHIHTVVRSVSHFRSLTLTSVCLNFVFSIYYDVCCGLAAASSAHGRGLRCSQVVNAVCCVLIDVTQQQWDNRICCLFCFYRFIGLSVVGLNGNAIARTQDTHNLTERNCTNNWIQNLPHSGARAEAEKAEKGEAEKATISPFAYFRQRQRINGNGNDSRQQENSAAECTRVHFNWFLYFFF